MYTRFANMGLFFLVAVIVIICTTNGILTMHDQRDEKKISDTAYGVSEGFDEAEQQYENPIRDQKPQSPIIHADSTANRGSHP